MKNYLIVSLLFLSLVKGQGWIKIYDSFSTSTMGYSLDQSIDGGYIITGVTGLPIGKILLIKTDSNGDTLWTKTYQENGDPSEGRSVQQTSDGGYIITGMRDSDLYLIKTDSNGDTSWTMTYDSDLDDVSIGGIGYSVKETTDGGYIITGNTNSPNNQGEKTILLLKTDINGDTLWTKTYGDEFRSYGFSVKETSDGGYIITGNTQSYDGGDDDIWLIKTDSQGDSLWTKLYDDNGWSDKGRDVNQTTDGGYIITGSSGNESGPKIWLIKTDTNGDTLWTNRFGSESGSFDYQIGRSVQQTSDGGYIITGNTGDGYLIQIKTDSNGDSLWTKIYGDSHNEHSRGYSIQQTTDGGYIITGWYVSLDKLFLMKTDSEGNTESCDDGFINYGGEFLIDCYSEGDLEFLQLLIDNSQGTNYSPPSDLSPIDLGVQTWEDGRLTQLCISNGFIGTCLNGDYELSIEIPSEIGNLDSLNYLDLSGNELSGNQMVGEIPMELWNLTNLSYLNLSGNLFTGVIPDIVCDFNLDWSENFIVSDNKICPPYPSCVDNFIGNQDITDCLPLSIFQKTIPRKFLLREPYPNPFNPSTTIELSIPSSELVKVHVFDMVGNKINIIFNDYLPSGNHKINWNGNSQSSGVYFIRIESGDFIDTKKVILLK